MSVDFIVAFDRNYVIARKGENALPWSIPSDLRRFKELTMGHNIIMGRKTWESLPDNIRPLPGRETFVLTTNKDFTATGAHVVNSLKEVDEVCANALTPVMVIGGSEVFKLLLPKAQKVYCTFVNTELETHGNELRFPFETIFDSPLWAEDESERSESYLRDSNDDFETEYQTWIRQG